MTNQSTPPIKQAAVTKLLMFDLDGTLIDSAPDIAIAGNKMLTQLGMEKVEPERFGLWVGNGATVMVNRALSRSEQVDPNLCPNLSKKSLDIFMKAYLSAPCVATTLYADVAQTLKTLKDQGNTIAVITNKPAAFISPILTTLNIAQYIDFQLGGDDLPEKKPHPLPLLHTCKTLGFEPQNAIMIGDSTNDIQAAHNAGINSIGLTYGYNYAKPISDDNPNHVFDHFKDILTVLG